MEILIVGAGAVGQPYGLHFARGGANVSALVRPARHQEAEAGYTLTQLRIFGRNRSAQLQFERILSSAAEVSAHGFDQVWLCTPTDALPTLLDELPPVIGDATVVCLQPGVDVRARMRAVFPDERLVFGAIGVISFPAPLPGAAGGPQGPGLAYMFPPGTPTALSGAVGPARAAVEVLRRGGCPARLVEDSRRSLAFTSGIIQPLVAGLELESWSLSRLRHSTTMDLVARAADEAVAIGAVGLGTTPPAARRLVSATTLRLAFGVAPALLPFDFEAYLRFHFLKVGAQTRRNLRAYVDAAAEPALSCAALEQLVERLS